MFPVKIPGSAAGKIILKIVCFLLAPSAKEASRQACGTWFNAASVVLITIGSASTANVSTPESKLTPKPQIVTKKVKPKRPKITLGTPERLDTDKRMAPTMRPDPPYSVRYTAVQTPKGSAMTVAPTANQKVPTMQGQTPPAVIMSRGGSKTNSQESAGSALSSK